MAKFLKNIARYLGTGFLLFALSGFTVVVHHEHSMGNVLAEHEHGQSDGIVLKTTPQTYHEVHIVKLVSGDCFNGSQRLEFKDFPIKLSALQLDSLEFSSVHHLAPLANIDIKETGPPSVDQCILFCSFLI